jgi:hypothetical protein
VCANWINLWQSWIALMKHSRLLNSGRKHPLRFKGHSYGVSWCIYVHSIFNHHHQTFDVHINIYESLIFPHPPIDSYEEPDVNLGLQEEDWAEDFPRRWERLQCNIFLFLNRSVRQHIWCRFKILRNVLMQCSSRKWTLKQIFSVTIIRCTFNRHSCHSLVWFCHLSRLRSWQTVVIRRN